MRCRMCRMVAPDHILSLLSGGIWPEFSDLLVRAHRDDATALEELPIDKARNVMAEALVRWAGAGPPLERRESSVLSVDGADIPIVVYHPLLREEWAEDRRPVVVFFHGGGFVLGSVLTHDAVAARIAVASGATVVSVDYPLAPSSRSANTIRLCAAAVDVLRTKLAEEEWWSQSLGVAGDSAGATIAGLVCAERFLDGRSLPDAQLLFYPATAPTCETESWERLSDGFFLTRRTMRWFWAEFLGPRGVTSERELLRICSANPGFAPKTTIVVGTKDPLFDENLLLADCLRQNGASVDLRVAVGAIHGFAGMSAISPRSGVILDEAARAFGRILRVHEIRRCPADA
jgi:acetyl esterase